jgi:hypothetical protein
MADCPKGHGKMRREVTRDGVSDFCSTCLQHHKACTVTKYMEQCELSRGHKGPHKGARSEWAD